MPKIVILTGPIASGKSTVRKMFAALNIPVIDADVVVHESYQKPESEIYKSVYALYGDAVLDENKHISRTYLRNNISTSDELKELERLVTIPVKNEMLKRTSELNTPYVIWEVPLYKKGWFDDAIVVTVVASDKNQREMFLKRGKSTIDAFELIKSHQLSTKEYSDLADIVVNNDSTIEELNNKVIEIHNNLIGVK